MALFQTNLTSNLTFALNLDMESTLSPGTSGEEVCGETLSSIVAKYALGSLLVFIIFVSIAGNILVCVAIYTDRRLRKLGNLFLASLALADLFVASLVMTFAVANDMMGYWMFGEQFCETWIAFDIMLVTASIVNLCAISLDRFIHIKDPLRYDQWMSKKVVLTSVGCIWLLSGLVSFLPISLGWHKPDSPELPRQEPKTSDLSEPQVGDQLPQCALDLTPVYAIVSSSISFYVPCLIMVGLYTRLYLYARKHVKNIKSITKPIALHYENNANRKDHQTSHRHVTDHKAAITLGIIMGVFLVCWVPFFCINIIASFCKTCIPLLLFKALTWLGWFNSAMNPVIYSIFNTEFREAFRRILVTYVRKECCEGRNNRRTSRSLNDPPKSPKAPTGAILNAGPHSADNIQNIFGKTEYASVKGRAAMEVKNKIELTCHHSEGKISAI